MRRSKIIINLPWGIIYLCLCVYVYVYVCRDRSVLVVVALGGYAIDFHGAR